MGGYVVNFTVYTMAMTGLICFAVFVYKKIMDGSIRKDNSKFLCVEESMNLTPRKTLHIVRAGNEKFLIASDVDRTTLISKLGSQSAPVQNEELPSFDALLDIKPQIPVEPQEQPPVIMRNRPTRRKDRAVLSLDFPNVQRKQKTGRSPMQEMAKRINEL